LRLLLDSHVLLWAAGKPERLSAEVRALLLAPENALFFSSASLWEITVKTGLGRADFTVDPRRLWRMLTANGYTELPVTSEHAIAVRDLPGLHKDPFDRLLIAQANIEAMKLVTADALVAQYAGPVMFVA